MRIIHHEGRSLIEALFTVLFFDFVIALLVSNAVVGLFSGFMSSLFSMQFRGFSSFMWLLVQMFIPVQLVSGVIFWLLWSFVTHVIAKLIGGEGDLESLLLIYGYGWFTNIIVIIPFLFYIVAPVGSLITAMFFLLVKFVWVIYIYVIGVKEIYGLSTFNSLLAVFIIPIVIILILSIVFFGFAAFLAGMVGAIS